jgi:hypothetical protein
MVLGYLVALTHPLADGHGPVPGWWSPTAPTGRPDPDYPHGHANLGLAHGISGPLALLCLAARRGVAVPGQLEAITAICDWNDQWRRDTPAGARWPYTVGRDEADQPGCDVRHDGATRRPSWCYGTAGHARAQQLAALALGDPARRSMAEAALIGAITDTAQLAATRDSTLCHGYAGLAQIAARAAEDAEPTNADRLRELAATFLSRCALDAETVPGLLEGAAGIALAALCPEAGAASTSWDTCLLIT